MNESASIHHNFNPIFNPERAAFSFSRHYDRKVFNKNFSPKLAALIVSRFLEHVRSPSCCYPMHLNIAPPGGCSSSLWLVLHPLFMDGLQALGPLESLKVCGPSLPFGDGSNFGRSEVR